MSEFLAPLNDQRAHQVLQKLTGYVLHRETKGDEMLAFLGNCYPMVFSKMHQQSFANHALLLEKGGTCATDPLVFSVSLDIPDCTKGVFLQHPSDTLDDVPVSHAHFVCLLEALEELFLDGYRPSGDLFLCISMDGLQSAEGAKQMADHLSSRKIHPCFVLSHGGYVTMDAFRTFLPNEAPLALVGITEKGVLRAYITMDETLQATTSYAKMSPFHALLQCGAKLSCKTRHTALVPTSELMLKTIGWHASFFQKSIMLHPKIAFGLLYLKWRNRSVFKQFFQGERILKMATATTVSTLQLSQSLLPSESMEDAKQCISRIVAHYGAKATFALESEFGGRSDASGEAWDALLTAIEIQFDRVVTVPCLCSSMTDGRHYMVLNAKVYRFSPFLLSGEQALHRTCTINEDTLQTAVQFFRSMLSV